MQGQGADGDVPATAGAAPTVPDGSGADGSADQSLSAAHDAILAEARYQFTPTEPVPPSPPGFWERFWSSDGVAAVLKLLGKLLEVLFWVGLVALAALIVWFAGRAAYDAIRRWRAKDKAEAEPEPYRPAARTARTLLDDAGKLAAQGRYGEAVRLILRRSIEDIERQHPGQVRDAMTSREIGVLSVLSAEARPAFARIAALVERAAFAGRDLVAAEYEEARGIYETLTKRVLRGGR